jgi:hypothetical protein
MNFAQCSPRRYKFLISDDDNVTRDPSGLSFITRFCSFPYIGDYLMVVSGSTETTTQRNLFRILATALNGFLDFMGEQ